LVTTFPLESSTATTGCGLGAEPAVPLPGCVTKTSCVAVVDVTGRALGSLTTKLIWKVAPFVVSVTVTVSHWMEFAVQELWTVVNDEDVAFQYWSAVIEAVYPVGRPVKVTAPPPPGW
jgi:hypothetical protein